MLTFAPKCGKQWTGSGFLVSPDLEKLDSKELKKVENLTITKKDVASATWWQNSRISLTDA